MRVSVIIPAFNVQQYVEEAVRSAFASSWENVEVICVDDGSTDNTLMVLHALQTEFRRLRVLHGGHTGASAARNVGIREASGTYVQFLDADDLLAPNKLEHQVELAVAESAQIVAGAYNVAAMDSEYISTSYPKVGEPFLALMSTGMGITSSNLFHTEAVRGVGGWDETKASSQEADLMFRMLVAGASVSYDEEPLTTVRRGRTDSISATDTARNLLAYAELRQEIVEFVMGDSPDNVQGFVDEYFDVLQRLAEHHPDVAAEMYQAIQATGNRPSRNQTSRKPHMLVLTRLVGFRRAQRLRYGSKRVLGRSRIRSLQEVLGTRGKAE